MRLKSKLIIVLIIISLATCSNAVLANSAINIIDVKLNWKQIDDLENNLLRRGWKQTDADGNIIGNEHTWLEKILKHLPVALGVGLVPLDSILSTPSNFKDENVFTEEVYIDVKPGMNRLNFEYDGAMYKSVTFEGIQLKKENVPFKDVNSSHWARNTIAQVASQGLLNSIDGVNFKPNEKATFVDMYSSITYLLIANDCVTTRIPKECLENTFKGIYDVNDPIYNKVIAGSYSSDSKLSSEMGINYINNISENAVPLEALKKKSITRLDLASAVSHIIRTLDKLDPVTLNTFKKPVNDSKTMYYEHVDGERQEACIMVNLDIMTIDKNGNFNPNKTVTRAELAEVLLRTDKHLKTHVFK